MRGLRTFLGFGWAYDFTITSLPSETLPQICDSLLKSNLMQVCKSCHYKAVEPLKLHPMSMLYIKKRFDVLLRLLLGTRLPTHTIATTEISSTADVAEW